MIPNTETWNPQTMPKVHVNSILCQRPDEGSDPADKRPAQQQVKSEYGHLIFLVFLKSHGCWNEVESY